jgi:hypothetical protein
MIQLSVKGAGSLDLSACCASTSLKDQQVNVIAAPQNCKLISLLKSKQFKRATSFTATGMSAER